MFKVDKDTDLEVEMMGKLPSKLQKLSITGKSLKTLSSETLQVSDEIINIIIFFLIDMH